MGSREGVAAKIDVETKLRLEDMIRQLTAQKEPVIGDVLNLIYDIKPELHKNYRAD